MIELEFAGGLFGTSLRRARVYNSRRSVCFALPLRTLALCTFQAARRGRRGEEHPYRPVRAARASSSRRGSRGARPLRVQDGVFYRLSFGFDR
jgi:hypothetical protein